MPQQHILSPARKHIVLFAIITNYNGNCIINLSETRAGEHRFTPKLTLDELTINCQLLQHIYNIIALLVNDFAAMRK